ncbi:MAG TPA: general secretion pathway protein GspB [Caldimonas sp.]|jgi:general secretion pathway protein B
MSYILDALRRADAERERGAVPSLQSQQHAFVDDDAAPAARSRALVWAVAGLAVALVAAVAWNLFGSSPRAPARPSAEGAVAPAVAVPPVLLPTTPVATPPGTVIATPPEAAPATVEAAPKITAAPRSARPRTEPKRTADRRGEGNGAAPAGEPNAAPAGGDVRIYKQAELPEDIRRDLPKLVIGGASYSGDAASRMVMINGQVFHEGDRLAPQLVLERIKLKSAVLSYKGYRYEVTF